MIDTLVNPAIDDGLIEALVPPCTDAPDQFFSELPQELEQAKILCRVCPVRAACLESALARREPWGVWGGEVLDRGRVIARKRGPGRPRKQPLTAVPSAPVEWVPAMREPLTLEAMDAEQVGERQLAASVA